MDPLRITFVLDVADLTGGNRVISVYADRLRRRGHHVAVVSRPLPTPSLRQRVKGLLRGKGWPATPVRQASHLDAIPVRQTVIDRRRPITDRDVPDGDVVIATWWETAEWVAALSPNKGAKVHFVQHHEVFDYLPLDRVKATYRLPLHRIVISRWLEDIMRDKYGDTRTSLVLNSVDTDLFFAAPRGKQRRPTVGIVYHPQRGGWKGGDTTLAAIERAKATLPDLHLVAFSVDAQSAELPLPPGSTFTQRPSQPAIRDLYGQCDVFLSASRVEGFGLPPLEAMACRCPVVTTRVGALMDFVENGRNGYILNVDDVGGLAKGLVDVLSLDEPSWRAMSDAALATVLRYTWDDATNLFEAALGDALGRSEQGRVSSSG